MNVKELPEQDRARIIAGLDKLAYEHRRTLYKQEKGELTYPLSQGQVADLQDEINHISALRLLVWASALRIPEQTEL